MNRMIPVLMVMFLLFGTGSAVGVTSISDLEAYNKLSTISDCYIIDVRTVGEWAGGHPGGDFLNSPVQKVFNIPLFTSLPPDFTNRTNENAPLFQQAIQQKFDSDDTLIFMCASGGRAKEACNLNFSLSHVFNLGKFSDWQLAYPALVTTDSAGAWDPSAVVATPPLPGVATPLPGSILLMASGLLRLVGLARRQAIT